MPFRRLTNSPTYVLWTAHAHTVILKGCVITTFPCRDRDVLVRTVTQCPFSPFLLYVFTGVFVVCVGGCGGVERREGCLWGSEDNPDCQASFSTLLLLTPALGKHTGKLLRTLRFPPLDS